MNKFLFPEEKPDVPEKYKNGEPQGWCCGDSKRMLFNLIEKHKPKVMFELGSFLGMSANFIMERSDDVVLYCIDHWEGSPEHAKMGIDCSALYETFLVNVWKWRARIRPVRMESIEGMAHLHLLHIQPDVIYIDAGHDYNSVCSDIRSADAFFPDAVICGDDYTLASVRDAVGDMADLLGYTLVNEGKCWRYEG